MMQKMLGWFGILFPEQQIDQRRLTWQQSVGLLAVLTLVFYIAGLFFRPGEYVGFDWVNIFSTGRVLPFYPPWASAVHWLNWPLLVGLSCAGVGLAVARRSVHPINAAAVFLSLPLMWTLFLGQLEGLVVLGLAGLPLLTPLSLLKPQISVFAFAAKKSTLLVLVLWLAVSLLIWGWWPQRMFAVNSFYAEGRYAQDISIGWIGAILALPMAWFSRGDMDMLMLSGSVMTPHLIPYNMLPFAPAAARLRPWQAILACLFSWLPLSANWLGNGGWWLGWVYVFWLWGCLAVKRYKTDRPGSVT